MRDILESPVTWVQTFFFILVANIMGTNIFLPDEFTLEYAWRIWTWSIIADVVFIITMSAACIVPLYLNSKHGFIGSPIAYAVVTWAMVYIGYMISWYFVCNLSDDWSMDWYGFVHEGDWGVWSCAILSAVYMAVSGSNEEDLVYECPECRGDVACSPHFKSIADCPHCRNPMQI